MHRALQNKKGRHLAAPFAYVNELMNRFVLPRRSVR
jgi:hypothetical protein